MKKYIIKGIIWSWIIIIGLFLAYQLFGFWVFPIITITLFGAYLGVMAYLAN